ncbi:uncharacterized protein LOC116207217 [Punica granatum]|uniref:Uncharacterized protein LOC116207217 n=2 Tax=Punica granatum TaxID=22663 RepID=A0A6P8DNG2_PUNGR|nr:uncharacterized protein LOC116207217 [Punica granatum]PKI58717.1 hypothetical protein CRG98_020873 [Punica granatum]
MLCFREEETLSPSTKDTATPFCSPLVQYNRALPFLIDDPTQNAELFHHSSDRIQSLKEPYPQTYRSCLRGKKVHCFLPSGSAASSWSFSNGFSGNGTIEQLHRTRYKPEHPHFLRVMLPELLQLGKLPTPKAFVKNSGNNLLNRVLLKVSSGQTWTIQLEKHNGTVLMVQGWKNFVEYFSVVPKYSISFRWDGSSMFHTIIFDQTGCQIKYSLCCSCCKRPKLNNDSPSQEWEETPEDVEMAAEVDDDYRTHLSALGVKTRSGVVIIYKPPGSILLSIYIRHKILSFNDDFLYEKGRKLMRILYK